MGVLRRAGIFLEMGNLPNGKQTGCPINCPGPLPATHSLENLEGYREIGPLCFNGFKEGDSQLSPILGTLQL